jgi:hypothetical protein
MHNTNSDRRISTDRWRVRSARDSFAPWPRLEEEKIDSVAAELRTSASLRAGSIQQPATTFAGS